MITELGDSLQFVVMVITRGNLLLACIFFTGFSAMLTPIEEAVVRPKFRNVPLRVRIIMWEEMKRQYKVDKKTYQKQAAAVVQHALHGAWSYMLLFSLACMLFNPPSSHSFFLPQTGGECGHVPPLGGGWPRAVRPQVQVAGDEIPNCVYTFGASCVPLWAPSGV
jgi:hypothetical protein